MDTSKIEELLSEQLDATDGSEHQKYNHHFIQGLEAYSSNRHEDALKNFEQCLKIAQDFENQDLLEFFAYYGLGYSHALTNRYGQTVDCFDKCLNLSKQITSRDSNSAGGRCFTAFAYIALGDGELFRGRSKKALTFFKSGLELAAQMHDNERELVGYLKLADVYKTVFQYPKALEHYNKCLEKAEEKTDNQVVLRTRLRAQQGLGDVYNQTGQFNKALKHYEESLTILSTINDDKDNLKHEKSLIFAAMGYLCGHTGQSTRSVEYYEKCEELSSELSNKSLAARACLGLGHIFALNGKCFEAITNFKDGLKIAVKLSDKHLEATSNVGHGDVYMLTGDISTAIEYYQESLEIADESELHDVKRTSYLGLGNAYAVSGRYSDGLWHLKECLKLSLEVGDRYHECQVYRGFGDVNIFDGRYEAALEDFEKGLHIAVEIAERNCQSRAKRSLGDALTIISKKKNAVELYEEALKIAEDIDNTYEKSRSHLGLGKLFKSVGSYKEALEHYEKGISLVTERTKEALEHHEKGISLATEMSERNLETTNYDMDQDQIVTNEKVSNNYMKGLPFPNLTGNKFGTALTVYWELGDLYYGLKEYQKALAVYERYLSIAEETNDFDEQERACKRLVDIWTILGRTYMARQFILKQQAIAQNRQKSVCGMCGVQCRYIIAYDTNSRALCT